MSLPGNRSAAEAARPIPISPARVVLARDPAIRLANGNLDLKTVSHIVHEVVKRLTGSGSSRGAWSQLFSPDDVVGPKINCLAGRRLSTRPEVVQVVIRRFGNHVVGMHLQNGRCAFCSHTLPGYWG